MFTKMIHCGKLVFGRQCPNMDCRYDKCAHEDHTGELYMCPELRSVPEKALEFAEFMKNNCQNPQETSHVFQNRLPP